MIYVTNIIIGNYQLVINIKKNYNGIDLALEYAQVDKSKLIILENRIPHVNHP